MRILQFILPCSIVLMTFGCTKQSGNEKIVPDPGVLQGTTSKFTEAKIRTIEYGEGSTGYYEYDEAGRLSWISEPGQRTQYIYPTPSKVIVRTYDASATLIGQSEYELNSEGLAVSRRSVFPASGSGNLFAYNNNRQLTRMVQNSPSSLARFDSRFYYNADGRLDSTIIQHTNTAGVLDDKFKLSYAYPYIKPYTIAYENMGQHFLGKQTTQAYDSETYSNIYFPLTPHSVTKFEYEFDAQDRMIMQKRIPQSASTHIMNYTYY